MKTKIKLSIITLFLLAAAAQLQARGIRMWSYAELRDAADIVVIAKPISNTDTKDVFNEESGYIGINTEFEVLDITKGDVGLKKVTVLHFKHKPGAGWADGMAVAIFRMKGIHIHGALWQDDAGPRDQEQIFLPVPEYMLFLKKRSDGRYEPATGQMDARLSVKEVSEPFPSPLSDE